MANLPPSSMTHTRMHRPVLGLICMRYVLQLPGSFKVTVLTFWGETRAVWFKLPRCSNASVGTRTPVASDTLFNISWCLLLWVHGRDRATSKPPPPPPGSIWIPSALETDKRRGLAENTKWPPVVGTAALLFCGLWPEVVGNAPEMCIINSVRGSCLLNVLLRADVWSVV